MGAITLQFCEGSGLESAMIKWFGHGKFSHVDCVLPEGTLLGARSDTIQGIAPGVRIRPKGYIHGEVLEVVKVACSDDQEAEFYRFLHEQIGKPYNKMGIFAFVFATDWTTEGAYFCSELIAAGLASIGILAGMAQPANKIDPDDLRLMLSVLNR